MNKKYIMFSFAALFAMVMVSAALVNYYGQSTHIINVESPVEFIGADTSTVAGQYAGTILKGDELKMINHAGFAVLMQISDNSSSQENDGIETSYFGNLELTKKNVDFGQDFWTYDELDDKVQIRYTVFGDEFSAEVVEEDIENTDYVLIYYKDNSNRFNEPARARTIDEVKNSGKNLPYENDGNVDEYDYCVTAEYVTCHGAKIWYVPSDAILSGGELDWGKVNDFYFESSLIQYNADGQITVYPGETLDFTPEFDVSLLFTGVADITTTVTPIVA